MRGVSTVAFFGPSGTFTEQALLSQPDLAAAERIPLTPIPDVIAAVNAGRADLGVIPIENSIEGSVAVTLDTLAFESDLLIQREVDLPISLGLFVKPGVKLRDIETVLSYPHAVAQCRKWLQRKLPGAAFVAANSTADAARTVARSRKTDQAAIGNALAAELHGLDVLAPEIADHPENQTRFVVVGQGIPAATGHDRTSIVCFQRVDRPGSLLAMLHEFAARAINLTKLESRPTKQSLGDYCFFIDFEGHVTDEIVADCLRTLAAKVARREVPRFVSRGRSGRARASHRRRQGVA